MPLDTDYFADDIARVVWPNQQCLKDNDQHVSSHSTSADRDLWQIDARGSADWKVAWGLRFWVTL